MIFDEDGIHEITENSEQMTKYSSVEKMYVEDSALYIYFSSAQAYIVPYACLGDEAMKEGLVEYLKGKIEV